MARPYPLMPDDDVDWTPFPMIKRPTKTTTKTAPLSEERVLAALMQSSDNLRSLGWAVDVSPGINADGRKGFVLTALAPTQPVEQPKEEVDVPTPKKPARKAARR